ncbi:dihydrodipicolinate synthase family protein [Subtercola lobariae]|uniref:Dihydrodipicolinate synthase family protein n=1 Tax=Subtercola lobariae TaxID=1588641 RepID=A0A917F2H9_9MICO|nr:dihydrodipicolinate synthase family protein [Subtercola lobariae]GGF41858.1 dihydrodipicolinate synthase family protein [Subtercola lobariae]
MLATVSGLMPILATPFTRTGELDRWGLRRVVEFELSAGVSGVAVFGFASEGFTLTSAERQIILADVRDVAAGAVSIVAGISGTSTVTAIEQALQAEEGGADVLMAIPPFMVKPPAGTLSEFYGELASATRLPIMVQDAPGMTGVAMAPAVIAELSRIEHVDSVKIEAPPTPPKIEAVVDLTGGSNFAVFGGQNAQFVLEEYERGSVGTMPACEFSDELATVLSLWNAGRGDDARFAFRRLLPLIVFGLQPGLAWAVHKEVLVARGLIESARVRYPSGRIDAGTRRALATILDELSLPVLRRTVQA